MLSVAGFSRALADAIGADHRALATDADAVLLFAIPVLWVAGVLLVIVLKFRSR